MPFDVDVVVVGAGPCGATLANLLGVYGVSTVVIDREPGVIDYPRAVAVDDESLRTFQTAGVVDEIVPDLIQNAPIRYHDSHGKVLAHVAPSGQVFGWPRRNLFYQPLMEAALRRGLERFEHVRVMTSAEVTHLEQDAEGVRAGGKAGTAEFDVRARYAVGADGGRSFVRGAAGLELTGSTAPSKWLVVDVEQDTWDAPYSAVYCDPHRPTMTIPLPYGRRRFEFKLLPDEHEDTIVEDAAVQALLRSYYTGGEAPVVSRRRVYWHHSRIASRFQSGRVFLAGDAAHLQPPFFGQGMNSGIRDATNLAWKLAAVTRGHGGARLLDSYDQERREHAEKMVSFATRVGAMYQPRSRATETVRDAVFRGVQQIPGARDYILQMKYKPLPRYTSGVVLPGFGRGARSPVGRMFPQPTLETGDGAKVKLDDALGTGFAVLAVGVDPADWLIDTNREYWRDLGARLVRIAPPRTSRRAGDADPRDSADGTVVLHDALGAFRDMVLSRPDEQAFVLRPDRYVAAVGRHRDLDRITVQLRPLLGAPSRIARA